MVPLPGLGRYILLPYTLTLIYIDCGTRDQRERDSNVPLIEPNNKVKLEYIENSQLNSSIELVV